MLTAYLTTLIIGGSLLGLSIFGGGDHEMDHDVDGFDGGLDADADFDGDLDAVDDAGGFDVHGLDSWLPFGSLRFWTFFCAFFGLVGTALTLAGGLGFALTLAPSVAVGYLSGVTATKVLRNLTQLPVGKVVSNHDLVGTTGQLLLPVAPGQPGKIRMQIGGRTVEQIASSEEEEFAAGAQVLVIGFDEDGAVLVSPAPMLKA